MSIIYVLIPLAIIIVAIAIGIFFWAVKANQFDDLERQGYSILFDDDIKQSSVNDGVNDGVNNAHVKHSEDRLNTPTGNSASHTQAPNKDENTK